MQAKDIPERDVLRAIEVAQRKQEAAIGRAPTDDTWTWGPDLYANLAKWPPRVVTARLRSMRRRGLVDGCACGCRGDWHILPPGRALLDEAQAA